MTDLDDHTTALLDELVPSYSTLEPDWTAIIGQAEPARRRRLPHRTAWLLGVALLAVGLGVEQGLASRLVAYLTQATPTRIARHDLKIAEQHFNQSLRSGAPALRVLQLGPPQEIARLRGRGGLIRLYAAVDRHRRGYCVLALLGRRSVLGGSCQAASDGWAWEVSAAKQADPFRVVTGILPTGASSVRIATTAGPTHAARLVGRTGLFVVLIGHDLGGRRRVIQFRNADGRAVLAAKPAAYCFNLGYRILNTCSGGGIQDSIPATAPTEAHPLDTQRVQAITTADLERMHATGILKVVLAPPPELWSGARGDWMYLTLADQADASGEYDRWEANVLAGAVRAQALALHAGALAGYSTLTPRTKGCGVSPRAYSCLGIGTLIQSHLPYHPAEWLTSTAAIQAMVITNLETLHLKLVSLRFIKTDTAPIPVLTIQTTTTRLNWTNAQLIEHIFGDTNQYEAEFIRLLDTTGTPIYAAGTSTRTSGGGAWTAHGHFSN